MTRITRRSFVALALVGAIFSGCKPKTDGPGVVAETLDLPDGVYTVDFETDSPMFHLNETRHGKALLTVKDGVATLRLVMPSKNVVNLFPGKASDAEKEGAALLTPDVEKVVYDDGATEEVYAFDVPAHAIGTPFDLALLGTKGAWYDHRVTASNPEPYEKPAPLITLEPGEYAIPATLEGGSGRASVVSPVSVVVDAGGYSITLEMSSPYYDYMIVDGKRYEPVVSEGAAIFKPTLSSLPETLPLVADSTAMSRPHEIEYRLVFDASGAVRKQPL